VQERCHDEVRISTPASANPRLLGIPQGKFALERYSSNMEVSKITVRKLRLYH